MARWFHLKRGEALIRVRSYLIDDYSIYWYRREGSTRFRFGLGVVVGGLDRSSWGSWALFVHGGEHDAYVKTRTYVVLPRNDPPLFLSAVLQAHVARALSYVPRHLPVDTSGDDPRRGLVHALADVGRSRYVIVLQGGEVRGRSCRALVVSPIHSIGHEAFEGKCHVRFVPSPSLADVLRAAERPLKVSLPIERDPRKLLERAMWGIVVDGQGL